jgi:protein-disulfide isomerase
MVLLCVAGLAASVELTLLHVHVYHDPEVSSFCAYSDSVNCDTVALSHYSIFLGVPVAVWGILGYLTMALVALWGWRAQRCAAATGALVTLTTASALVSAVLATVSVLKIASVCVLCIASYVTNFALLVLTVILVRRTGLGASLRAALEAARANWRRTIPVAATGGAGVVLLIAFYPRYWVPSAYAARSLNPPPIASSASLDGIGIGVTEDGHHWIGAREPELVIEEYSDYQCPFCAQAHLFLRALVQTNADRLRLVHRQYPLDHQCNPVVQGLFHPNACAYAAIAACSGEQGKFWQVNDYLYAHGRDDEPVKIGDLVAATGVSDAKLRACLTQRAAELLKGDLSAGLALGIRGTPTFRIRGKLYLGELPQDVMKPYFDVLEAEARGSQ